MSTGVSASISRLIPLSKESINNAVELAYSQIDELGFWKVQSFIYTPSHYT